MKKIMKPVGEKLQQHLKELSEVTGLTPETLNVIKMTILYIENMEEESQKLWKTLTLKEKTQTVGLLIPKQEDTTKNTNEKISNIGLDEIQTYKDIAEFQNEIDELVCFIDIDNNFNSEEATKHGVNMDNLLITKRIKNEIPSLDRALEMADNLVRSRAVENIYLGFKLHIKGYDEGFGDENIVDIYGSSGGNIRRLDLDLYNLTSFLRNSLTA